MNKLVPLFLLAAATASADTSSELSQLEGTTWTKVPALPRANKSDAVVIRGAYVAPDGTQILGGYTHPDASDVDSGAIYRKDPGGAWKLVYSKPGQRFGSLFGTSVSDLYVTGINLLLHWDGKTWSEVAIPKVQGDVIDGWTDGEQLFVVTTTDLKTAKSWIYRRDEHGTWSVDGAIHRTLNAVGSSGDGIYAIGNLGTILRRTKPGVWLTQPAGDHGQCNYLYAASASDIYVAGSVLLHSRGDGKWAPVKLPTKDQVLDVWGRSSNDVFVGTMRGLFHFDGQSWSEMEWKLNVGVLAGNAKTLLVTNIVFD